jgi:peptide/nickel transport system substrate-binding protein
MPRAPGLALPRRALLASAAAALAAAALPRRARAMGRTPLGGRLTLHVPWPTDALDPHDLADPAAALFASAIADPLFALDPQGNPYPALAAAMPSLEDGATLVRLREGLRTARGEPLGGRDLVASLERARARGAAAILAGLPAPRPHPRDGLAALFRDVAPADLAVLLASPLLALLPRSFSSSSPDGTGAFRAEPSADRLLLAQNPAAARGASFLDAVEVRRAPDLRASLSAFEAGRDDIGWLGAGLYQDRKGAVRFDLGRLGLVVLATSPAAGAFGAPGAAQELADALPAERLAHLGLSGLSGGSGNAAWLGPPTELLVDGASPHLVEIADAVAVILTRPQHEVTARSAARGDLARLRAQGKALLALELVRPLAPDPLGALLALATADDPARARELARRPPKLASSAPARTLTRTLRVGVVGEARLAGAVAPDVVLARAPGEGWDLGASYRRPKR